MPDFKCFLSWVGTSSFYFLDMHWAYLTKKWGTLNTLPLVHSKKGKAWGLYWNAFLDLLCDERHIIFVTVTSRVVAIARNGFFADWRNQACRATQWLEVVHSFLWRRRKVDLLQRHKADWLVFFAVKSKGIRPIYCFFLCEGKRLLYCIYVVKAQGRCIDLISCGKGQGLIVRLKSLVLWF